jgi:hypothetical protein
MLLVSLLSMLLLLTKLRSVILEMGLRLVLLSSLAQYPPKRGHLSICG